MIRRVDVQAGIWNHCTAVPGVMMGIVTPGLVAGGTTAGA